MPFMIGWVVAAILGGLTVVRIVELLFGGLSNTVLNIIRPIFFVGTVTTVTTQSGMSRFTSKMRKLQRITHTVGDRVNSVTKKER